VRLQSRSDEVGSSAVSAVKRRKMNVAENQLMLH
jgi:hypothetical protein